MEDNRDRGDGRHSVAVNEQELVLDMPVELFLQVAGCSTTVEGLPHAMEEGKTVRELPRSIQARVMQRMRHWKRLNEGFNALNAIGLMKRLRKSQDSESDCIVITRLFTTASLPISRSLVDLRDERAVQKFWRELENECVRGERNKESTLVAGSEIVPPSLALLCRKSSWAFTLNATQKERVNALDEPEKERSQTYENLFETASELQIHPFILLAHLKTLSAAPDDSVNSSPVARRGTHAIEWKRVPVIWSRKRNALLMRLYVNGRANFCHLKGERLWRWLSLRMRERTGAELSSELCRRRVELLLRRLGATDAVEELIRRKLNAHDRAGDEGISLENVRVEDVSPIIEWPAFTPTVKECGTLCGLHRCLLSIAFTPLPLYSSVAATAMLGRFTIDVVNAHMETLISTGVLTLQQPTSDEKRRFRLSDAIISQMPELFFATSDSASESGSSLTSAQAYPFLAKGRELISALLQRGTVGEESLSGSAAASILLHIPNDSLLLSPTGFTYDTVGFDVTHTVTEAEEVSGQESVSVCGRSDTVWPWTITGGGENETALMATKNAVLREIVKSPGIQTAALRRRVPWLDCCSLREILHKLRRFVRVETLSLRGEPSLFSLGEVQRVEAYYPQHQHRFFHS